MARRVNLQAVEAEIHDAVEGLVYSADPRRIESEARLAIATVLHRHGLGRSRVNVRRAGRELLVDVQFPPGVPEVLRVRIGVGHQR
ncbi:MAG: hypothetical protein VX899_27230 [Myxococcota bacterium]|nr:hypothetical protein [Myxococcota bacterium]